MRKGGWTRARRAGARDGRWVVRRKERVEGGGAHPLTIAMAMGRYHL